MLIVESEILYVTDEQGHFKKTFKKILRKNRLSWRPSGRTYYYALVSLVTTDLYLSRRQVENLLQVLLCDKSI